MSNIDKRPYRADGGDIGAGRLKEIADNVYGDEEKCWLAKRVLTLLDELEAAEERYEDMLRQARSFREAHDYASELIRKMERNKPAVILPTTRLWAGKIACYEESEVVAMLESAGVNIAAAAGKGEAS